MREEEEEEKKMNSNVTLFNSESSSHNETVLNQPNYPFSLNDLDEENRIPIYMETEEQIMWSIFFSIMVTIAAGGNLIVIYIVTTNKEMKSVTNYFLVNLCLSDTMVSTLNVIFNFTSMLIR